MGCAARFVLRLAVAFLPLHELRFPIRAAQPQPIDQRGVPYAKENPE